MLEELNDIEVIVYMNDREKVDFGSGIKIVWKLYLI